MKSRLALFSLLLFFALVLTASGPAAAQTVYENGPISGATDAWTINFGFAVDDTFTVSSASGSANVSGLSFGVWLSPGDTLVSAEVSLTSEILGGTTYFDQQVNFATSNCFINTYGYNICQETATFTGPTLNNGTYWLNLQGAVDTFGDPVYWDENNGVGCHSQGCPSNAADGGEGTIPSEAFTLLGDTTTTTTGSTPEPSSLLLFASGILGAAGVLRRKFF